MLLQRQRDPLQKAVHPPGLGDLLLGGASSGPLPQWRCLRLAGATDARARAGPWHEGGLASRDTDLRQRHRSQYQHSRAKAAAAVARLAWDRLPTRAASGSAENDSTQVPITAFSWCPCSRWVCRCRWWCRRSPWRRRCRERFSRAQEEPPAPDPVPESVGGWQEGPCPPSTAHKVAARRSPRVPAVQLPGTT